MLPMRMDQIVRSGCSRQSCGRAAAALLIAFVGGQAARLGVLRRMRMAAAISFSPRPTSVQHHTLLPNPASPPPPHHPL